LLDDDGGGLYVSEILDDANANISNSDSPGDQGDRICHVYPQSTSFPGLSKDQISLRIAVMALNKS
jgi:hypothetical protein